MTSSSKASHIISETIVEPEEKEVTFSALEGCLLSKDTIAQDIYTSRCDIAEEIDTREKTSVPYRRNAVRAASLISLACVRGANLTKETA